MKKVYLDYGNAAPVHPEVIKAMLPYFDLSFGNPMSFHDHGQEAREAVEKARSQVAALINAEPSEIYFVASGSEANNFAVKGIAQASQAKKRGNHIIVSAIEHASVLNPAEALAKQGFVLTQLPVDKDGFVDPGDVATALTPETILVSVTSASNEIGTIEPIEEIGKIARENGIPFHTDAVQTVGQLPVDVKRLGVDLLTLAGQTFYAPKGTAALYIRKGVRIKPFIEGGTQEGGRRAGTENVPGIVGMGKAAEIAIAEMDEWRARMTALRDKLIREIPERIDRIKLNGHPTIRVPNNVNFCVEFIEGEATLMYLMQRGVAAASGSACTSTAGLPSHVLMAIGVSRALAQGSLLFTLGKDTREEDIGYTLEVLTEGVKYLRSISPLYEEG